MNDRRVRKSPGMEPPIWCQRRVSEFSAADSAATVSALSGTSASAAVITSTGTPVDGVEGVLAVIVVGCVPLTLGSRR